MSLLGRLGPPLALMAVIFIVSDQAHLSTGLGIIDLVGRKLAHMTEYGLLWWLWLRALHFRRPWLAAAAAVAYAATDEYHQSFVPGRDGNPLDVGIDSAGVLAAWLLTRGPVGVRRRRRATDRRSP